MKKFKYLVLVALLAAGLNANAKPVVGDAAPDFATKDIKGNPVKLADLKDKVVVLEWNNPNCPFVKKHYESKNMQDLQKKYTEKGVVWVSINSSAEGKEGNLSEEDARNNFIDKGFAATNYVIDADGSIGHLYGASTTPHMYVINKGTLVYQGAIDSIASADKADIAKADNYVAKALDEVLGGKAVTTAVTQPYGCGVKYNK